MKTNLLAVLLITTSFLSAQTSLKFCVDIGTEGTCKSKATEFTIGKDGGTISFLLKSDKGMGLTQVIYKIYKLEDNGKETYASSLDQKLQKEWTFAWQEAVFYDEGTYKVKVFDTATDETFICSNIMKIFRE